MKRKLFEYGGIAASVILIAVGLARLASARSFNEVRDNLARENIVGTRLVDSGQKVNTGSEARAFAP